MSDYLLFVAFLILGLVIFLQAFERSSVVEQHTKKEDKLLEENSRLIKAIIAKNANDYVMTTSIDKVQPEVKRPTDPDLIPEEALSDEEFMESIKKQTKK